MTLDDFKQIIIEFCKIEVQQLLVLLQQERFANQGAFNDNPKWQDNDPRVVIDKGMNMPLVDSGELKKELETAQNWKLGINVSGNQVSISIPNIETFTDPKYDVLDTGGSVKPYISKRGNKINIKSIPARKFKEISSQDVEWITDQLTKRIVQKFT